MEIGNLTHVKQQNGLSSADAEYVATPKNAPLRQLDEQHGFTAIETDVLGEVVPAQEDFALAPCGWIEVEDRVSSYASPA
jgi:predicted enzyme involved in methoxymalonyl-ACP biosynthesis